MIQEHRKLNLKKIFLDRDGDGFADHVDLQLHLRPSCSSLTVLSAILDLSACLGFETMGMDLPLAKAGEGRDPSLGRHLYIGMNDELQEIFSKRKENDYFLGGAEEIDLAKTIKDLAFSLVSKKTTSQEGFQIKKDGRREGFDLLSPFSIQGFYCGSSKIPLPILFPYKILLFGHLGLKTATEASNFASRLGLETLSLSLPLTFPLEKRPKGRRNYIYIGKKEGLNRIKSVRFKDIFSSEWDSGIFLLPSKRRIPDVLICGEEKGLRKILSYLSLIPMNSKGVEDPIFDTIKIFIEGLRKFIIKKGPSKKTIRSEEIVRDYTITDEKEEIIKLLYGGLKNKKPKPNSVKVEAFIASSKKERKKFEGKIRRQLKGLGFNTGEINITVLNAHKPGLSWMKEVVLKEISRMKVDRVEIAFKEFKDKGFEESIRWLQEIYPIDEIFAEDLSIPKEKIKFKKDSRIKEIYRVRTWHGRKLIYKNQFSPRWEAQPYLISFPRLRKVHPTIGWVKMNVDGEEIVNQRIKTGIERIWEIYQNEILSLIEKEANKVLLKRRLFSPQPIFEELRFDIYFNYPKELLGVGEERISPLEALHEDLYFVTLDFFSKWLKKKGIKGAFMGRVLPVIHPNFRDRNGRMRFKLVHRPIEKFPSSQSMNDIKISLNEIVFNGSKVGIDLFIEWNKKGDRDGLRRRIKSYNSLNDGVFKIDKIFEENSSNKKGFRLIAFGSGFPRRKRSFYRDQKKKPIEISMERPIGYREGVRLTHSLKGFSITNVVEEGRSSGGLPIFSIENTYPCASSFVSHAKRVLIKATFFINCRHHANEISSTNAGLKLSTLLATQPRFKQFLRKTNIVINPMENVDGIAIMEEMLKLTPTDKLHAGRYNKAGEEYYAEYFNPETLFGEAKVKPAIWERWLPDICVDNHGFPSHEWEQPFSGYAPFRFREFWIPRVLFYLSLPHLEGRRNSFHRMNSEALKNWIDNAISKNSDILKWNRTFSERYWKYRYQWFQKSRFSQNFQCLPLQKRFRRTNYSYRCPRITTVDFITEAADETAQGKFLKTCISAHLQSNLAVIRLLNYLDFNVKKIYLCEGGQAHFIWYRERPLVLEPLRKEGKRTFKNTVGRIQ
jgi:hypothetical protein